MKVFSLVGKSGTGKSHHAMFLCGKYNIPAIIDDGLLIYNGQVADGISAKRQATKIGAIKTALFNDEEHRLKVAEAIKNLNLDSILILGTSEGMVEKIAERLELPAIEEKIYIENITTAAQRSEAHRQRYELGNHVIPAPTGQLKKQFSGYFMHPIRAIKVIGRTEKHRDIERTVVRPTYSYLGEFIISDRVIQDIIQYIAICDPKIEGTPKVFVENIENVIEITVSLNYVYGYNLIECGEELQRRIRDEVSKMTAFSIQSINVDIRDLDCRNGI